MNEQQTHEATLMRTMARLDARLEVLHQDVGELKDGMYKLADAVTKLAVLEERQSQVSSAVERAFAGLSDAQAQIASLEVRLATALHAGNVTGKWVDRALVGCVALAAGVIAGTKIL